MSDLDEATKAKERAALAARAARMAEKGAQAKADHDAEQARIETNTPRLKALRLERAEQKSQPRSARLRSPT